MCSVMIDVPNEVLYDTNMNSEEAARFARQMVAIGYYTKNNVSIGYCAQIAGLTEEEFILLLGENQIDIFRYDNDEELMRDVANA
ncbi:MAG: UPF0175 family protein [Pseudobutyrivibrio sp.]|nr:UPF0175 family protein [Pseudobutyrivibrio sp.]